MRILLTTAAAALAAACATQAPTYQARSESSRYGYSEMQVQPNRLRISYNGDTVTPRETVETYLLYRSAESTLQRGFDYFIVVAHDADENTRYDAMGGRPRLGGVSYREISNHTAMAEIIMFEGDTPPPLANVYDARIVVANLQSRVVSSTGR